MNKLKMGRDIYAQYKSTVQNNESTTLEQAQLKMTRNAQLALVSPRPNTRGVVHSTHYKYGSLHFIVNKKDKIVWMRNYSGNPKGWKRDNKLYLKLNKDLGIEENTTHLDLIKRDIYYAVKRKYRNTLNIVKWKLKDAFQTV